VSLAFLQELRGILEFASRLAGLPQAQEPVIELKFHDGRAIPDYRHNLQALPSEGSRDRPGGGAPLRRRGSRRAATHSRELYARGAHDPALPISFDTPPLDGLLGADQRQSQRLSWRRKPPSRSAGRGGVQYVGTITSFCSTCQRDVYITEDDTPVCPVCSTPLIATVEKEAETE
jgi:hypothetical protein